MGRPYLIADHLVIAEKTVRNRLALLFRRLHLENRTQAAIYAMRAGIVGAVQPPDDEG